MITYSTSHPTLYERANIIYDNCYKKIMRGNVDNLCEKAIEDMRQHNFYVAVIWDDNEKIVLAKINRQGDD